MSQDSAGHAVLTDDDVTQMSLSVYRGLSPNTVDKQYVWLEYVTRSFIPT